MPRPLRTSERHVALLTGDAIVVTLAVVLALWTWSLTAGFAFDASFVRARVGWFATVPAWLLLLAPTRGRRAALDLPGAVAGIGRAAVLIFLAYLALFFLDGARLPRLMAMYLMWDAMVLLVAWRIAAQWSLTRARFSRRILIAGSGCALQTGLELVGSREFLDAKVVGTADLTQKIRPLDQLAARLRVTDLLVASQGPVDDHLVQQLLKCQEQGTNVVRMAQLYEETLARVPIAHIEPSWLLSSFFDLARFRDRSPLAKRTFDLIVGGLLGLCGMIVAPAIALAIVIESGRPVLYRQRRVGRGGVPFFITKFRSMRPNAEKDGAARWSPPGDPRVTRVGQWLRRTRLDELPNVFAILRGDMSVVGPRPERPEFIEQLEREVPFYRARLIVRPGLTGWAQVNVPYGDSVGDATRKLEYDLFYIKHQSIWFDALIVLRTVGTILRFAGR